MRSPLPKRKSNTGWQNNHHESASPQLANANYSLGDSEIASTNSSAAGNSGMIVSSSPNIQVTQCNSLLHNQYPVESMEVVKEERGEKRALEADPEYEDVSSHQNKRLRLREDDAKRQAVKKIESIIRQQFSQEMMNKEQEVLLLDERINDTRESLFKLRACLVAAFYGKANQQCTTVLLNRETKAEASIHPTLKRHLGKAPVQGQFAAAEHGSGDSRGACPPRRHPDPRDEMDPEDSPDGENLSLSKVDPALKLAAQASVSGPKETSRGSRYMEEKKIIIGNVSKFIPYEKREENDPSSHKWMLYVRGPRNQPDLSGFVEKVWFFLHPSYAPNDLVEVNRYPFHLTRRGWGEFPVRVQIHFRDKRNKKIDCIHKLKLDQTYTGLSTLGAETNITTSLLINPPDPSAAAAISSKPKAKTKIIKEEVNVTLNGVQESVVANIDGHVTIKHGDRAVTKVKVAENSSATPVMPEKKKTPTVKIEPMDNGGPNGLPKLQPISLLKDLPKQKDDIFIQCVNSQGSACFIPQSLFLESQKTQTKIPSPVRKRLNPPGSVSLLNRPRANVPASPTNATSVSIASMVTSRSKDSTLTTQGKATVVFQGSSSTPLPVLTPPLTPTGTSRANLNVNLGGQLPHVILSPGSRTMTSSVSPSSKNNNVIIPLQVSSVVTSVTSPRGATSVQPIRLPLIRASNATPVLRGVGPLMNASSVGMTSHVRPVTVTPNNNQTTLNRITLLKTAPALSRPVFQVNLATLGKLANAQQEAGKPIATSLLTSLKTSVAANTVATQLQAQRKTIMMETTTSNKIVVNATSRPSAGPATSQQIVLQNTKAPVTVNPFGIVGATPLVRPLQPQPQLVRANVGGKLVWLQLIPSQIAQPTAAAATKPVCSLTSPTNTSTKLVPSVANPLTGELSVFHKVAVPKSLPPSRKNPSLGRPPKQEDRSPTRVINLNDFDDMNSLLRVLVREFPLVAKTPDKSSTPYCARSLREFTLWNVGKKRAAERQRASDLRQRLKRVVRSEMFHGQSVPSVRQLVDWCREQGYTPVRVTRGSAKRLPSDQTACSLTGSDVIVEQLVCAHARDRTEDECEVEIVAVDTLSSGPVRAIKKEVIVPAQPQKNFYMSADERGDFIGDLVSPLGIELQPYPVAPSVYATVVSGMVYKAVRNMVEDVLRNAHADVHRQGRPDELTVADVHNSLSTQPRLDCLTMAGLGCQIDEDPT